MTGKRANKLMDEAAEAARLRRTDPTDDPRLNNARQWTALQAQGEINLSMQAWMQQQMIINEALNERVEYALQRLAQLEAKLS